MAAQRHLQQVRTVVEHPGHRSQADRALEHEVVLEPEDPSLARSERRGPGRAHVAGEALSATAAHEVELGEPQAEPRVVLEVGRVVADDTADDRQPDEMSLG